MPKIIAIGGVPATGKTTLMFKIISLADDWKVIKPQKLLDAMFSKKLRTVILGKYQDDGNVFQGTDRLSMAVQPDAEKFFEEIKDQKINVLFEGDRLFNAKMLNSLSESYSDSDFKIVVIQANHDIVEQRHIDRKDDQDEKFKRSRETKISNISGNLQLMDYIHTVDNNNLDDQSLIIEYISKHFNWSE